MSDQLQQGTASNYSYNPAAEPPQSMDFYSPNQGIHVPHTHRHQLHHVSRALQQQLLFTPISSQVPQQQQDNMQMQPIGEGRTEVDQICKNVDASLKQLKNALEKEKTSNFQLEIENERIKSELLDAQQININLQLEIEGVRNINFDLNQKLLTTEQEAAESKIKVEELEKKLENEEALQDEMQRKDLEINDLHIEMQTKSGEIKRKSAELSIALQIHNGLKKKENELLDADKTSQATIKDLSRQLTKYKRFRKAKMAELAEKVDDLAKANGKIEELSKENKQLSFQLNTIVELNQRQNSSLFKLVSGHGNKNMQQTYKRSVHEADEIGESSKKKRNDAILPTDFVDQERVDEDDDEEEEKVDQNNSKNYPAQYKETPDVPGTSASESACGIATSVIKKAY